MRFVLVSFGRRLVAVPVVALMGATGCGALWGFDELSQEADGGERIADSGHPSDGGAEDSDGTTGLDASDGAPTCKSALSSTTNLALNKPATADQERGPGESAPKANDGNSTTRWSASDASPHAWTVDLGDVYSLGSLTTRWEYNGIAYQYAVYASTNGVDFELVIDRQNDSRTTQDRTDQFPKPTCARFVRIRKTDATGYWAILYEVGIFAAE